MIIGVDKIGRGARKNENLIFFKDIEIIGYVWKATRFFRLDLLGGWLVQSAFLFCFPSPFSCRHPEFYVAEHSHTSTAIAIWQQHSTLSTNPGNGSRALRWTPRECASASSIRTHIHTHVGMVVVMAVHFQFLTIRVWRLTAWFSPLLSSALPLSHQQRGDFFFGSIPFSSVYLTWERLLKSAYKSHKWPLIDDGGRGENRSFHLNNYCISMRWDGFCQAPLAIDIKDKRRVLF